MAAPSIPTPPTSVQTHASILPGSFLPQGQPQGLPDKGKKDLLFEFPDILVTPLEQPEPFLWGWPSSIGQATAPSLPARVSHLIFMGFTWFICKNGDQSP